jgi:UDP-N-acetylmuramoylalanine--D-glutamate ligase
MKRIVVLGAGESGSGAAVLAKLKGFDVFVSDLSAIAENYRELLNKYEIAWEEQQHTEALILNADEVIKSPGIPDKAPLMKKIVGAGIPVLSEIEFAGRYTDSKMICITGSNGKTTTTSLIYHILRNAGVDAGLAGNIGNSLALQVAIDPHPVYVVELSSFQLDHMFEFKADVAVLLNITPDHLDRYDYDFQKYVDAKFRITQNQTSNDVFIYWEQDPVIRKELVKRKIESSIYPFAMDKGQKTKAFIRDEYLIIKVLKDLLVMPATELSLKGIHNTCNSMAAGLAAAAAGVRKEFIRESLIDFKGVEHRLEYVATVRNVKFINDSKATNVNSCWYALQSMLSPVVLILGGTDKGNDYSEIAALVKEKVRGMVFLGVDNTRLHEYFDGMVAQTVDARSMEEAVNQAYQMAQQGDTVLLSPCCASFDLFVNYEDRGRQFKHHVRNL